MTSTASRKSTSLHQLAQSIRDQLGRGEVEPVLDRLYSYLSGHESSLKNEVILQTSRYNRLRRDVRKGTISEGQATVEESRLIDALLEFIDLLPARVSSELSPVKAPDPVRELQVPVAAGPEVILGISNLKQISWVERVPRIARSVCRILSSSGLGTGFLIGHDRLMTNNHVIPSPEAAGEARAEFDYQEDTAGKLLSTFRYRLDSSYFHSSRELDYTIVGVLPEQKKQPLERWGYLALNPDADPVPGEHVVIIQHPEGGLKQIALTANQVVGLWQHLLHYTTDTMPGSSGSPVFNDQWQVVVIHHAGGELKVNAKGEKRYINEGVLMSAISRDAGDSWPVNPADGQGGNS